MRWDRLLAFACICSLASVATLARVQAQDADDDFVKEARKKEVREKATREGKDPDAAEKELEGPEAPVGPQLPATAGGWIGTIRRTWDTEKPEEKQLFDEAVAKLKEAIGSDTELQAKVAKTFEGLKEAEADRALDSALTRAGVSVDALRQVLERNRPGALKAIMNPAYTESDGCKLQPEVDKACKPLFGVWRDPVAYAMESMGLNLERPATKLDALAVTLGSLVPGIETWPQPHANAMAYMRAKGAEKLADVKKPEYDGARAILDFNEGLQGGMLTDEDKRHVRVLNDYRLMLGKGAVKINLQLVEATTRHSQYMEKIGQIGHNMDGHPDGRTPQDRAKRAGFGGSVAENCLMGSADGDAAVWQWYNAAEHHRNMIGNHTIIGCGHAGVYWCQNFSGGGRGGRG